MRNNKNLILISSFSLFMIVAFENCSNKMSTDQLASGVAQTDQVKAFNNIVPSFASVTNNGYIFYGSYGANPADPKGNKLCEYPGLNNCLTNAAGKSKGAGVWKSSGLSSATKLHKMSFNFQSNGFLSKNPSAHFAVGLRGHITNDANGDAVSVNGRGFIIGQMGGDSRNNANPTCANNMLQIESYSGDAAMNNSGLPANHIFSDTCSDSVFQEGLWYKLELYVSKDRKIGYKIFDANGALIHSRLMQDPYEYIDLNITDFFLAHVFESDVPNTNANWNYIVANLMFSQSDAAIETYFNKPDLNFSIDSAILADNAVVTYQQMLEKFVALGNFTTASTRIFGCANPITAVNSGASCSLAKDFREIKFSGDESFAKVGNKLKLLADQLPNYPKNLYKLILRTNPESKVDQLSIQVDTRNMNTGGGGSGGGGTCAWHDVVPTFVAGPCSSHTTACSSANAGAHEAISCAAPSSVDQICSCN